MNILEICHEFNIFNVLKVENNTNGLINKSYIIKTKDRDYIIQKINNSVFKDPFLLMNNIEKVINHLNEKRQFKCENLELISTKVGNNCLENDGEFYRCYNFVNNSITYDFVENPSQIYEMGKVLGDFQTSLSDFNPKDLKITIPDFHDTKKRFEKLVETFKNADSYKQQEVSELYFYIIKNIDQYSLITDNLNRGILPLRVVHNDTKLNNVIFDKNTKKAKCLIDLDTVMPGSLLFDFGDAVRSFVSNTCEDAKDLSNIGFDMNLFCYFVIGYAYKVRNIITDEEIALLIDSIYIITMEITIRFITDYLENNKYFMVKYDKHNLDRAKNQITLAKTIEYKKEQLRKIVKNVFTRFE
ncbi:MAG: phosphotransferase [Bacilli bacterium]|nr:phosphotransferase [Bacilli bacterium]